MSKVQSPQSQTGNAEPSRVADSRILVDQAHIGHDTLDQGLRVTDLRKSFSAPGEDKIEVLKGVSFLAQRGETVAIMGASGAGKSTLLHLLGGLETADNGSVFLDAFAISDAGAAALAGFRNKSIGFVFQFHHLLADLTAVENVSLPLLITRTGFRAATQRAARMLEDVGLGTRTSQLVGTLSGGEQQRVAVCRALISKPALVLADEPTGNLDAKNGDEIAHSLVLYARTSNAIVILATHNQAIAELCDRILMLHNGRLTDI